MHRYFKVTLTALTAAFLLASAVSMASARNLSVSNQNFRAVWGSLEFTNNIGLEPIRCRVTLEGSFHSRTITKTARSLIGAITRADVNVCTNGRATPQLLPWHVTYESFTGALPSITAIGLLLSRIRFLLEAGGGLCNATYGNETDNITGTATREAGGAITTLAPVVGRNQATLVTRLSGLFCPERGGFVGTGNVTVLNSTTRLSVTLI